MNVFSWLRGRVCEAILGGVHDAMDRIGVMDEYTALAPPPVDEDDGGRSHAVLTPNGNRIAKASGKGARA